MSLKFVGRKTDLASFPLLTLFFSFFLFFFLQACDEKDAFVEEEEEKSEALFQGRLLISRKQKKSEKSVTKPQKHQEEAINQ